MVGSFAILEITPFVDY